VLSPGERDLAAGSLGPVPRRHKAKATRGPPAHQSVVATPLGTSLPPHPTHPPDSSAEGSTGESRHSSPHRSARSFGDRSPQALQQGRGSLLTIYVSAPPDKCRRSRTNKPPRGHSRTALRHNNPRFRSLGVRSDSTSLGVGSPACCQAPKRSPDRTGKMGPAHVPACAGIGFLPRGNFSRPVDLGPHVAVIGAEPLAEVDHEQVAPIRWGLREIVWSHRNDISLGGLRNASVVSVM